MKNYKRILESVKFETDVPTLIGRNMSTEEIRKQMVDDLSVLFENRSELERVISRDILVYEYTFWYRKRIEPWFRDGLDSLLQVFRHAKASDDSLCLRLTAELHGDIDEAITNSMDIYNLQTYEFIEHLSLIAKIGFREIGDFLEGSLKKYMKYVLLMSLVVQGNKNPESKVTPLTLGQVTEELLNNRQFQALYQPNPWGLKISQWRNIAQHASYKAKESSGLIECEYGARPNKKTISLSADDLINLHIRCHDIVYLHKIAITFFFVDNIKEILNYVSVIPKLTEETVESSVLGTISVEQFEILNFTKNPDGWEIELLDHKRRNRQQILTVLQNAVSVYFGLKKESELRVRVIDTTGKVLLQGVLSIPRKG